MILLLLLLAQTPSQAPLGPAPTVGERAPGTWVIPSVDFSPALNLLEQVRLRVDDRGRLVKRRRTPKEIEQEHLCGLLLQAAQRIAHTIG